MPSQNLKLALDLEGVLITNAVSQFPRPGLMTFLLECESLFGRDNIVMFTTVPEPRFREIAGRLIGDGYAPEWFKDLPYTEWVGEHKDLRFVDDDIDSVVIVDDYPPYIKQTQKHRLIQVKEYVDPYTHEAPDSNDRELEVVIDKLMEFVEWQDPEPH